MDTKYRKVSQRRPTRYSVKRWDIAPAEAIRTKLNITPEEFSVRLGYSPMSYSRALAKQRLTRRMVVDVCQRFGVRQTQFRLKDGAR